MTPEHLDKVLSTLKTKADKDGYQTAPEGSTLTLYVSHDGASLSVPKVEAVRFDGDLLLARTSKKELFALVRGDLFAVAVEGATGMPARRPAGFGG